jgi:hypothetical protein
MPSIVETIELLEKFSKLPKGWNFGSGWPSAPLAAMQCRSALYVAYQLGLDDLEAFPGTDGEIQLNFFKSDADLELMFEINGTITITLEREGECVRLAKDASLNDVFKYLKEFQLNECRTSVSSILNGTTLLEKNVLQAPRLSPQAMARVYRSFTKNAAKNTVAQYVPTLQNITRASQGHRLSFGKSQPTKSQKIVHSCTA